jgi:hypothetical protein
LLFKQKTQTRPDDGVVVCKQDAYLHLGNRLTSEFRVRLQIA